MKKVVAYVRVSTDGQTKEDKYGIDVQKTEIQKYCDYHDMEILEWYIEEGVTGVKEERPQFNKILRDDGFKNPPYEAVVTFKNDRIARELMLYFYYKMLLSKKGVSLISVTEDFGEFGAFTGILEAFTMFVAEQERENIAKRTSAGRIVKSEKGGYSGGRVPYGYSVSDKSLVVNENEADIVKTVFELSDNGMNMLAISQELNKRGITTRKGGIFYASSIKSILSNRKTYEGFYKYGEGDWVKGQHKAILEV